MSHQVLLWGGFNLFVVVMLALDLGVLHRKAHEIKLKEALILSVFWTLLALAFNVGVYFFAGRQKATDFLAAYIVERSLSFDNLFVFILVFSYFKVPPVYEHKILFWGILGAVVLRAAFILSGVALIHKFHWLLYVFGAFLIFTGIKMIFEKKEETNIEENAVVKLCRRFIPVTDRYENGKFFLRRDKVLYATPLFLVLNVINFMDVVFAVDSIPACLAITLDSFIVYTSNIFAILGLRALYFALAGLMRLCHYLGYGLSVILIFVGVKMLGEDFYKIPTLWALIFIGVILTLSVVASIIWPKKAKK